MYLSRFAELPPPGAYSSLVDTDICRRKAAILKRLHIRSLRSPFWLRRRWKGTSIFATETKVFSAQGSLPKRFFYQILRCYHSHKSPHRLLNNKMSLIVDIFCCHAGEPGRPPIRSDRSDTLSQNPAPARRLPRGFRWYLIM